MGRKLHFIVTSEYGRTRSFSIKKRRIMALGTVFVALLVISAVGWQAAVENITLRAKSAAVKYELAAVKEKHRQMLARAAAKEEQQRQTLDTAMEELRKRSEAIESILSAVDIDIEIGEGESNTGGPFIGLDDGTYDDLTFKVDHYLNFLESMPLGTPVPGTLTSPFGRRTDPFTRQPAMHDGLDIHNRVGTKIKAPAAGVVTTSNYNRFNGNYLVIDHGNGFATRYLHLQRSLVKAGERVERGQKIARLGNTGRSTGPHLHYTILYNGEAIDPYRFVRVASVLDGSVSASGGSVRGQEVR
ncbi:M23 family metallopeptidase [Desulfurivibrio alkaliphilus]|uniref:Peptidase M23 n=1 Tax=Desulfurivibrio alkaliphilus (strain DSM 19089 / UNIQEM U267 / AHT2) TaxID=589865 RepID=D6Z5E6_DESAT|nr:M23 family metallopeptidase [Desulfurivibrio alkaliphilus]ADH84803.1 Peptidase M23 [Desulfurivibrio alkaliphilus AHT 2]